MRLAIPLVLTQDLGSSPNLVPSVAASDSSVYQSGSAETIRMTVQKYSGRLRVQVFIRDVATQQTKRVLASRTSSSNLLPLINSLARQIDGHSINFSTGNDRALEAFAVGLSSSDRQLKVQSFRDAIAADPSFGLAYIALTETLAGANSPDDAAVLRDAIAHRDTFIPTDRARFDLLRSRLIHAPLSQQIQFATVLIQLVPNDSEVLAVLASNLFLTGDRAKGERFMNRALEINPENANLRQQLATGLIETRQFDQAEKILVPLATNPATLPQLAVCILLEGDAKRAGEAIEKFVSSVSSPDAKILLLASWQALAGHLPEAIQQTQQAHFTDPRIAALAQTQLVTWQVIAKQYGDARQTGLAAAKSNTAAGQISLVLGTGAPSAKEWRAKVQVLPPAVVDEAGKALLTAYGLFLYGFYPDAVTAWQQIDQAAGGADLRARTMLAASLKAAGRTDEARSILVQPFVPELGDFYGTIAFNQLRALLGQTG